MQLLAEESDEGGRFTGLGWLPGRVEALPGPGDDPRLRSPHMGWNDIVACEPVHPLLRDLGKSRAFYFAHSYHLRLREGAASGGAAPARVIARCDYGVPIAAGVVAGNVAGFQFHPEKSQEAGLRLLRNFVDWSVPQ
jgi:glutamine amidotransferase